ncbi:MAG: hypothetical protein ACH37Z_04340 [Anaerolineae bacterium]
MCDSPFIHGLHDPGGEQHMLDLGKPGWVLFTEAIGCEPGNEQGGDYRRWSDQGLGVIVRLNNGYGSDGTIPHSSSYGDFARRCANFVRVSPGCHIWIIGNEMNFSVERPTLPGRRSLAPAPSGSVPPTDARRDRFNVIRRQEEEKTLAPAARGLNVPPVARAVELADRETITADLYARCFALCRQAIRALPGHEADQVIIGGVAPWNDETGDWVAYFRGILVALGPQSCDGIALHTYTHQPDPQLIHDMATMGAPYQRYHYQFRAYRDFMAAVPEPMRGLPVYITEADEDVPWLDANNGWVKTAYEEIDQWNHVPGNQQIRALILYRWQQHDKWAIDGRSGVIADFREAVARGYTWNASAPRPQAADWIPGDELQATIDLFLRRSPGYLGKGPEDQLQTLAPRTRARLLIGGPRLVDGLPWWPVRVGEGGDAVEGWCAQFGSRASAYLERVAAAATFGPDEQVCVIAGDAINLRRSPGYKGKTSDDVLAVCHPGDRLALRGASQDVEGLRWWPVALGDPASTAGWVAEGVPGKRFLASMRFAGSGARAMA